MTQSKPSVEGLMAQMRENYLRELPERFDEIETLILDMSRNADVLESLFRATHNLKGTAGTYGYGVISHICHGLEDRFTDYRAHGGRNVDMAVKHWLGYVDLMREAQTRLLGGNSEADDLQNALEKLRRDHEHHELRALVVVESALDQAVIRDAFSEVSVKLVNVQDGLQAMERLLMEPVDFYVLGNQLPRLNGLSIISAIRSNSGVNRQTPCILLSTSKPKMFGRKTDPDYVILRDNQFMQHLRETSQQLLSQIQRRK